MKSGILNLSSKKGGVLLRDIFMFMIVGTIIVVMAGILVEDVANSYDNVNMSSEYSSGELSDWGSTTTGNISNDMDLMLNATQNPDGTLEAFTLINVAYTGASTVFKIVFLAPIYISGIVAEVFRLAGTPDTIVTYVKILLSITLYCVIIFGIITALLRGSKV